MIWDPRNLSYLGRWEQVGLILPLEFSRISGGNRLTLVIDRSHGAACPTYFATSRKGTIAAAIDNLRIREGMGSRDNIGAVRTHGRSKRDDEETSSLMTEWAGSRGFDAAIWTELKPNLAE